MAWGREPQREGSPGEGGRGRSGLPAEGAYRVRGLPRGDATEGGGLGCGGPHFQEVGPPWAKDSPLPSQAARTGRSAGKAKSGPGAWAEPAAQTRTAPTCPGPRRPAFSESLSPGPDPARPGDPRGLGSQHRGSRTCMNVTTQRRLRARGFPRATGPASSWAGLQGNPLALAPYVDPRTSERTGEFVGSFIQSLLSL